MVKLRNAFYCNLKLTLIFLVIYGHWIEPEIGTDPNLYRIYRLIYLIHMPLFAFLSGLFIQDSADALRQKNGSSPSTFSARPSPWPSAAFGGTPPSGICGIC